MIKVDMSSESAPEAAKPGGPAPGVMAQFHLGDVWVRTASALVLVAAAVGSLTLGGGVFATFWLVGAVGVYVEWQKLIGAPLPWTRQISGGLVLCLVAFLARKGFWEIAWVAMALSAAFNCWAVGPGYRRWAAFGVFYAGGLLLAVIGLRNADFFGPAAIGWLFAVVWGTDVCAYFAGRLIGGPKLCRRISPGKTWSGAVVGVICGAAFGAVAGHFWPDVNAPLAPLFGLGLVAGSLAQCGDLFESAVKRRFDVKDSSHLIPGHGGFMDRLDGFIAAAIFAALFGLARGLPSPAAGLFFWQ